MKVNPTLAKYFRFCNYTGKYFCQNCHTNATSIIPAHILERWSFKRLYVSNFARDLLAKINNEPVFTITSTHSSIYRRVPIMAAAKVCATSHVTSHVMHASFKCLSIMLQLIHSDFQVILFIFDSSIIVIYIIYI